MIAGRETAAVAVTLLMCISIAPSEAQILNGDFGTGDFSGWTVFAEDRAFMPTTPLVHVVAIDGGFAANLPTGQFDNGIFLQILEQSFTVNPALPLLEFSVSPPSWSPDSTGSGTSSFLDELFVTISGGDPFDQIEPILVDRFGLLADPLGSAAGLVNLGPSDHQTGFTEVTVDLSQFSGQEVLLSIDTIQQDDGYQFDSLLIGNFAMRPIPEPATLWLVCTTGFVFLFVRKRN